MLKQSYYYAGTSMLSKSAFVPMVFWHYYVL